MPGPAPAASQPGRTSDLCQTGTHNRHLWEQGEGSEIPCAKGLALAHGLL